jgi:hypothetical protein
MTIDTKVFVRILAEHREAGVESTREAMLQTTRFGCIHQDHIRGCAEDSYQRHLDKIKTVPLQIPA